MSPIERVVIGIIWGREGNVLITQRRREGTYPLHWEFPGGRREKGESETDCLVREVREELGIEARPYEALGPILYAAPPGWRLLKPYQCLHQSGEPRPLGCRAFQWVRPADLGRFRFPPANAGLVQWLGRRKGPLDSFSPVSARPHRRERAGGGFVAPKVAGRLATGGG